MAIFRHDAFPKGPRTGKTPFRGKISPPCIQNQLILARYALHVCKMPCKMPSGNAFREYLATKTLFSVRIPQIMHSGQILPLFFDLSFVRELCDSYLRGSSGRDQHRGSTFTGVLACPLREGASVVVHCLSKLALLVISAPSTWRRQRRGSSPVGALALRLALYVEVLVS